MANEGALRVQLDSLFEDLVSRSQKETEAICLPEQLCHYSNVEGLKGILDSGKIWATQSGYLNDFKEVSYGRDLALDVSRKTTHQGDVEKTWLNRVAQGISNGIPSEELYVSCFCEQGDLLSQWRGYGQSCGYSVRLRPRGRIYSRLPEKLCSLVQVIYNPEAQRQLIKDVLDRYLDSLNRLAADFTDFLEQILQAHVSRTSLELESMFSRFKHPGFEEEREWRLIHYNSASQGSPYVEYRPSNGILVPYVKLPLLWDEDENPGIFQITQITCGPSSQPEAARASVEHYLTKLRIASNRQGVFDEVPVTISKTPLKTW